MNDKQRVLEFLNNHPLMVVSTIDADGEPQSAVVGFGQTDKLELIFGTSINSRKAQNILENDKIAAVIGWDADGTVQYEGTVRRLDGEEADKYAEMYFQKAPSARKHNDRPDETYFLITPSWLRFTEITHSPWKVTELTF